jgi:predicted phosphodiesterase
MNKTEAEGLLNFCRSDSQRRILEAIVESGSRNAAARELGLHHSTVNDAAARVKEYACKTRGYSPDHDMTHPTPEGYFIERMTHQHSGDGELERVWTKSKRSAEEIEASIRAFIEAMCKDITPHKRIKQPKGKRAARIKTNLIIGDAHLGMFAWGQETGRENHNLNIGLRDLKSAAEYLIETSPSSESIAIVNLGDLLHCNDPSFTTPASGNQLDHDGRFPKVARAAGEFMRHVVVKSLEKFSKVEVYNVRGNHDASAAFWINYVLEAYFAKNPRVQIVRNETKLLHYSFGSNFVPLDHGEKGFKRLHEAITRDHRQEHGAAKFTYCWTGHIHHKVRDEIGGVHFEAFNTLIPPDQYHADKGYGSAQSMTSIVLDSEYGEVDRKICSLNLARSFQ